MFICSCGFPNILIELLVVITLIPINFNIFEPHFNLGLSFLLSSCKFLKRETPFAFAAIKNITKNSSIALLLNFEGQFKDGKRNGKCKWYHENGNIKYDGECKDDVMCGKVKIYDEDGYSI